MDEFTMRLRPIIMPFVMIAVLLVLMMVSWYIFYPGAFYVLEHFFGVANGPDFLRKPELNLQNPLALLFANVFISAIGTFLFPAVVFHIVFRYDMKGTIGWRRLPAVRQWLLAIGLMLCAIVFSQFLVQVLSSIPLSGAWQSLREGQQYSTKVMDAFFADKSMGRFGLLVFCLCLMPAVAEELFFRASMQNLLMRTNLGPFGAIFFSGSLFALFHNQFDNFLAIWCLGIVLGMVYYCTGSIWSSIVLHFLNNFLAVAGRFAYERGYMHSDVLNDDRALPFYITLPAGALMVYGMIVMKRWHDKGA